MAKSEHNKEGINKIDERQSENITHQSRIPTCLAWSEIEQAPKAPGLYAWYSQLLISNADIEAVIKQIKEKQDKSGARTVVENALDRLIFSPYRETPYHITLRGQLKPKFSGEALHEPPKPDSLIERLADNPERFRAISYILKYAAPWFTAPLYIGMAINLRDRLIQHRNKIVELRDRDSPTDNEMTEAGFANQVVARNFDPTNLFVHITQVTVESSEHNDLENILNRINYPIFGRN